MSMVYEDKDAAYLEQIRAKQREESGQQPETNEERKRIWQLVVESAIVRRESHERSLNAKQ